MTIPSIWFLCRDQGKDELRLSFEYEDGPGWEKGDVTDLGEKVLHVFSREQDLDVVAFLNALYVLEGFVEDSEDIFAWRFKATMEKIIRVAASVVTSSSHEASVET